MKIILFTYILYSIILPVHIIKAANSIIKTHLTLLESEKLTKNGLNDSACVGLLCSALR